MCYPCLVSYFSIFPEDEKKCPICMNRISARCLRPVAISVFPGSEDEQKEQVQKVVQNNQEQVQNKHKKSVTIKMRLMKRHNMVMIALTRRNYDIWAQETKCESLPSCLNPENLKFSKFTLEPNENFLSNILEDDLLELLSLESTEDDTISLSADRLLSEITSLRENASQNAPLQNTPSDHLSIAKINDILSRNDSSEYEIEYPSQDDGASAYLYYQCSSGKPLFLDPLDNKIVMATYKEYLNLPDLIEVTVHSTQNFSVSEYTRSRYKFLAHLFLGTEAKFCETDLVYKCPEEVSKMLGKRLEARKNKLNYLIYNKNCTKDKEEVFMEDAVLSHELEFYDPIVLPPLNDMRHWPEIGSSANTPLAKNSSNDVEGSTNDVEGSTNDVEGSTSDIKGSANDIKCSTNDIKCSTNDVEGSTSDIKGSANDIKCSTDNIKGSSDHIKGSSDHIKDNQPIMSFAEVLTLSIKKSQDEE